MSPPSSRLDRIIIMRAVVEVEEDVLLAFERLGDRVQGAPSPPVRLQAQNIELRHMSQVDSNSHHHEEDGHELAGTLWSHDNAAVIPTVVIQLLQHDSMRGARRRVRRTTASCSIS